VTLPLTASQQFGIDWSRFHAGQVPIGWRLRENELRPWVRFHGLPQSKRYAQSETEALTILLRANLLAERLLGSGALCWIVERRSRRSDGIGEIWQSVLDDDCAADDDPEDWTTYFYVREEPWEWGKYDATLTDIADDRRDIGAIWMRRDNGAVFAPYDGGFDLFPATWAQVGALRQEYREWLSIRPNGL